MEIGKPIETTIIEPESVPGIEREPVPKEEPVELPEPEREPETVPA